MPADSDSLYWWVDCQFLPFMDNELCCTVGAYLRRPGQTPLTVSNFIKGLVYTIKFTDRLCKTRFISYVDKSIAITNITNI